MRKKVKKFGITLSLLSLLVAASACSSENNSGVKENPDAGTAAPQENTDPFGKYDPPIKLSTVKILSPTSKSEPGETVDKNIWNDGYLKDLGIEMKVNWTVTGNESGGAGEQKMNVSIASGDLPDIIPVNQKQLQQLVDAGMAEDLADVIAKYASPQLKEFLESNNGLAMKSATFDGKVMALPSLTASADAASLLWVRKDWLEKLGLPEPKTMEDVLKISDAFTRQDPDGNGQKDTYGLGIQKTLYDSGVYDLSGFFEGFHAYKNLWIKDASGKLVYGGVQPEMKTALGKLQEMFKTGQIDPEFGVKDGAKVAEMVVSGKIGMFYGQHWNAFSPLSAAIQSDPEANWLPYPIVSADGNPATPSVGSGFNTGTGGYYVFKKGSAHPEALVKLANYYVDKQYGFETGGFNAEFHSLPKNTNGTQRWFFAAVIMPDPDQNLNIYTAFKSAVVDKNMDALKNLQAKAQYDDVYVKYQETKDIKLYPNLLWIGPENSAFSVVDQYVKNGLTKANEFYGANTPAMTQKLSTLNKLQLETYSKIILGGASVDEFDQFVEDWKKLGGGDITKEINDWYAQANKK